MNVEEFSMHLYDAAVCLVDEVVTDKMIDHEIRNSDPGDDLLLPSICEVKTQLVWEHLKNWMADEEATRKRFVVSKVTGICGTQRHTWVEIAPTEHDTRVDPVKPVFVLDVAPAGIVPAPILVGPSSPLRMGYGRRTVEEQF